MGLSLNPVPQNLMDSEFKAKFSDIFTTKTAICGVYGIPMYPVFRQSNIFITPQAETRASTQTAAGKLGSQDLCPDPRSCLDAIASTEHALQRQFFTRDFCPQKNVAMEKKLQIYELGMLLRKSSTCYFPLSGFMTRGHVDLL